jgi:hypothetical protein
MQICFDNNKRLKRKSYLLEYKGRKFKLIQNDPRKWSDCLLTVLPAYEKADREAAFQIASEFLSALSWRNKCMIMVGNSGGCGWNTLSMTKAKQPSLTFPKISIRSFSRNHTIDEIPHIKTDYQRKALMLYREANASNNEFLSFIFFWQILETRNTAALNYVNNKYPNKRKEFALIERHISSLPLNRKKLGNYLLDDCRHAIAHIRRDKGKESLNMDCLLERERFWNSLKVVKAFAEHYIKYAIDLNEKLILVRKAKNICPFYEVKEVAEDRGLELAYNS